MLQLDGFPTGDGVKVKVFIPANHQSWHPLGDVTTFQRIRGLDCVIVQIKKKQSPELWQPCSGVARNKSQSQWINRRDELEIKEWSSWHVYSLWHTWLPAWLFVALKQVLSLPLLSHSRKSLYPTFLWQQLGPQARRFLLSLLFRPFSFFPLSLHPIFPSACVRACVRGCVRAATQADRSAGRLTGSMMELQTLQEALKVEIQIHQVSCVSRPLGQWVSRRLAFSCWHSRCLALTLGQSP